MSPSAQASSIQALPSLTAADYEFVGEGAANIVFEVLVQPGAQRSDSSSILNGNLLRVPKAGTKGHTYLELQEYWETVVKPLFNPEDLVQHELVRLGGDEVISRLNAVVEQKEDARRADFRGSRVAAVEYGMLIEDMRKKHPNDLILEFKPKWLAQSPNAPPSATRCRNCAREALKLHTKATTTTTPSQSQPSTQTILCPLNFLTCATSQALTNILTHLTTLTHPISPDTTPQAQYTRLTHWLQTNTLLPRLRAVQLTNDTVGPLGITHTITNEDNIEGVNARFQLAMTLRDCTCFVRVPADASRPVEAKLADLDKKNWAAKLGYWKAMERRLVEGGYYEGGQVEGVGVKMDCQLGRLQQEGSLRGKGFERGGEGEKGRGCGGGSNKEKGM